MWWTGNTPAVNKDYRLGARVCWEPLFFLTEVLGTEIFFIMCMGVSTETQREERNLIQGTTDIYNQTG